MDLYDQEESVERDFYFLSTLDLKRQVIDKLVKASFRTREDFKGMSITALAKEANISHKEALEVMNKIKELIPQQQQSISVQPSILLSQMNSQTLNNTTNMASALDMFEEEKQYLITMCREVDEELLNGGIPCGSVTEICEIRFFFQKIFTYDRWCSRCWQNAIRNATCC